MYPAAVRTEWIARSYFLIVQGSSDTGSNLFPKLKKKKKERKKDKPTLCLHAMTPRLVREIDHYRKCHNIP